MTLHIFRKDSRRLWPAIVAAILLLGTLARLDRWRGDWLISSTEGYLNILIPIAWACLIALAVEQDAIPGDRQFWITRPFRTRSLFAAKALFAVLFVHVPSLAADCYILAMRGFSPLTYASTLLAKQLVLACALTIPALALASLVRSFSHFVMEVVAVAAIFLVLNGPTWHDPYFVEPLLDTVRREFLIGIVAVASIAVLIGQYGGRRVLLSRGIAVGTGVAAALFFAYLLPPSALALRTAVTPSVSRVSMRLGTANLSMRFRSFGGSVALPLAFDGLSAGEQVRAEAVETEIVTASGQRFREVARRRPYNPSERLPAFTFFIASFYDGPTPQWIHYNFEPALFPTLSNAPVTVRGKASVEIYRLGEPSWLRVGEQRYIAGAGRCVAAVTEDAFRDRAYLKVECESPDRDPRGTRVRVWDPRTEREWKSNIGSARSSPTGPMVNWLSPLYRDLAFFTFGPNNGWWNIPREDARNLKVEITPEVTVGHAAVDWEFRDVDLTKYENQPYTTLYFNPGRVK
jgi:hypothetical protein